MHPPVFKYQLPNRSWSFGANWAGQTLNWITSTWFRFNLVICALLYIILILVIPRHALQYSLEVYVLLTPLGALVLYFCLKFVGIVAAFLRVAGPIVGFARVLYCRAFCHLIEERSPDIDVPAWFR